MFTIISQDEIDDAMLEASIELDYEVNASHLVIESYVWACRLLRKLKNEQESNTKEGQ